MIELENKVVPYKEHIRKLVDAETVYCSQWREPVVLRYIEDIFDDKRTWFRGGFKISSLLIIGMVIGAYAILI